MSSDYMALADEFAGQHQRRRAESGRPAAAAAAVRLCAQHRGLHRKPRLQRTVAARPRRRRGRPRHVRRRRRDARRHGRIAGEPRGSRIDLEFNFPILPAQAAMIAKSLEGLDRGDALQAALQQSTSIGTARIAADRGAISGLRGLVAAARDSWCSPATDGRASPRCWPHWCRPAAAAASRRSPIRLPRASPRSSASRWCRWRWTSTACGRTRCRRRIGKGSCRRSTCSR